MSNHWLYILRSAAAAEVALVLLCVRAPTLVHVPLFTNIATWAAVLCLPAPPRGGQRASWAVYYFSFRHLCSTSSHVYRTHTQE
jgi:hypothetical protein